MSALLSMTPLNNILLTHLSQEPHICINNLDHHWFRWWPVTSWTNADLLLIGSLGTNFNGIRTQIQNFHKSLWNVYEMAVIMSREGWVNSLVPRDATWRHRTMSTLVQVMACCLTAPSHCLNQCWLNIIRVLWHSLFYEMLKISILDMSFKITYLKLQPYLPGANELRVNILIEAKLAISTPTN